jgi:ribonuclease P protein component
MQEYEASRVIWISDSREIQSLRRKGDLLRSNRILMWVTGDDGPLGEPRVGVVMGSGFRTAVERNLAKRRIRGCVQDLRRLLAPGRSYLVEGRPGIERYDYQKLVNSVEKLLEEADYERE